MARLPTFPELLNEAIRDMSEHGYDSAERLARWMIRLRRALEQSLKTTKEIEQEMRRALAAIYTAQVDKGRILDRHPGVEKFTLEKVKPALREELSRRIAASADLIKLNRDEEIEKAMRRFAGWATAIPPGGQAEPDRREASEAVKRGIAGLSFRERRVVIDQGHKLTSAINDIVAQGAGAIAGIWHSHWRQPGYNYREDHKERDEVVYLIRDSWADEAGLVKPLNGYTDDITQPGEEVFCRCFYQYIYTLGRLPPSMLTAKGKRALGAAEAAMED